MIINQQGIAWQDDKDNKYKNIQNPPANKTWKDVQWLDMESEHFMVWMRTAGLPNFRKLWGKIETPLLPGKYVVEILNNYDMSEYSGKKTFVLSTTNLLGGKNYFMAIAYLVVGILCIIFAVAFAIAYLSKKSAYKKNKKYKKGGKKKRAVDTARTDHDLIERKYSG